LSSIGSIRQPTRKKETAVRYFKIVTALFVICILAKWDCAYDGHKFGGRDSNGFKTCSECGLTVKA
jgi:hypothetical protein